MHREEATDRDGSIKLVCAWSDSQDEIALEEKRKQRLLKQKEQEEADRDREDVLAMEKDTHCDAVIKMVTAQQQNMSRLYKSRGTCELSPNVTEPLCARAVESCTPQS
eukprot:2706847-Amphidinium_carterae.1